jgi:spore maturation protein CgeB
MNSPELPTPGTHFYTTSKFVNSFKYHGYNVSEAKTLESITDNSIVMLSNHGMDNIDKGFNALKFLANKFPNAIYICWFYHKYYNEIPFKKFVITGEHFHKKPVLQGHIDCWNLQNKINNYVPLTFSSSLFPEQIGSFNRNELINGCFIGSAYKPNWVNNLPNIFYVTGNNLPENQRIQAFLSSKIAFGFHADDNIKNNVVVERVFEGMAYGCVVISDTKTASDITDNIVQYASTEDEFKKIYERLLNNDDERKTLQKRGYEWIKQNGLYVHVTQKFIDKFNELQFIHV